MRITKKVRDQINEILAADGQRLCPCGQHIVQTHDGPLMLPLSKPRIIGCYPSVEAVAKSLGFE